MCTGKSIKAWKQRKSVTSCRIQSFQVGLMGDPDHLFPSRKASKVHREVDSNLFKYTLYSMKSCQKVTFHQEKHQKVYKKVTFCGESQ